MTVRHVVVVPSTISLLPCYAALEDPVADVRLAAQSAVSWLVSHHPDQVRVLSAELRHEDAARGVVEPAGARIARQLLAQAGFGGRRTDDAGGVLVVANGSARRGEKAPGHLDERCFGFDEEVDKALRAGDPAPLAALDPALGEQLWAFDTPVLRRLGEVAGKAVAQVDYADDPYGVQYWVVRWECAS